MRSQLLNFAILSIEVVGALLAVFAACAGYLFWRVDQGPIYLDFFEAAAEVAVDRQLPPGHSADIDRIHLARDKIDGAYDLFLDGLTVVDEAGRRIVTLDNARFNFTVREILNARFRPRTVILERPEILLRRSADRRYRIDYGAGAAGAEGETNLARLIRSSRYLRDVLESAVLSNATLRFEDEATGRRWRSERAEARVARTPQGYAGRIDADFLQDGRASRVRLAVSLNEEDRLIDASLRLQNAPVSDLLEVFFGQRASIMRAPVSGAAEVTMTEDGDILRSSLKGSAADGEIRLAGAATPFRRIALAADFDPARGEFDLHGLDFETARGSGEVRGIVGVAFDGDTIAPSSIRFDLQADDLDIADNGVFPDRVSVDELALSGAYDARRRHFAVDALAARINGNPASGRISFEAPRASGEAKAPSPAMAADFVVGGELSPDDVLALWPVDLGLGARDFVRERISRGRVSNLRARLDLGVGELDAAGGLPNEALDVTFRLSGATVEYAPGMTPLTDARGDAVLNGNRFTIAEAAGRVGDIVLSQGGVDFTAFRPRGSPSYFRFTAEGDAGDILSVLNEPPLLLLEPTGVDPRAFSGPARARIEIMRPNRRVVPRNRYRFTGRATFEDLNVEDLYAGVSLDSASGAVDLQSDEMSVAAEGLFGGSPVTLDWRQLFYAEGDRSRFRVKGEVDSATADIFGVATRQFLRGAVSFDAEAVGDLGAIKEVSLSTDFTDAILLFDPIGWVKADGAPATGSLSLSLSPQGVSVRHLNIEGEGVEIAGDVFLGANGRVENAAVSRLYFDGAADLFARASRDERGALKLLVSGPYLNLGPMIEAASRGAATGAGRRGAEGDGGGDAGVDWGAGVEVRTQVDALELRGGVRYFDADVSFWRDAERIQRLSASARGEDGAPLSVGLAMAGGVDGPIQTIEARTDDIGDLLKGVFGLSSVRGGQGVIDFFVRSGNSAGEGERAAGGLKGVLEARNFTIVDTPLLAQIFAAGSFTGLANLVNGDGIDISQAFAEFALREDALVLRDLRAAGPSVGLSAEGWIAGAAGGGIDLSGAVAPAYQVNSFLGKAPVIGDLFVNRDGEGVVALSYSVKGSVAAPKISVNPLSALAPGFMRRIFEPERPSLDGYFADGDRASEPTPP